MPAFAVFTDPNTNVASVQDLRHLLETARAHATPSVEVEIDAALENWDFEEGYDGWEEILSLQPAITDAFFATSKLPQNTAIDVSFHVCNSAEEAVEEARAFWEQEAITGRTDIPIHPPSPGTH